MIALDIRLNRNHRLWFRTFSTPTRIIKQLTVAKFPSSFLSLTCSICSP